VQAVGACYRLTALTVASVGDCSPDVMEGLFETTDKLAILEVARIHNIPVKDIRPDDPRVAQFAATCEQQYAEFKEHRHPTFKRPAVIQNRKQLPPHKWWQLYCNHIPELQSIAIRILSQVGAASICERNWSVHGMVHNKRRSRLKTARAIKLVFAHQTIRLIDSLNDPTWKDEPMPWADESSSNPELDSGED
jgi:hypothetical protein